MILVVGATGLLGGMITRQLLTQGKEVRILARENSPSEELAKQGLATPAQSLIDLGASPISGDLKEPASLAAAYAAAVVDNPAALNQTIEIGGPESYSWTEAVQAIGRVVGQELPVNYVPPGEPLPLLDMWATGGVTLMETSSDSFIDMSETSAKYGVAPTSLDTAMQRMFGGAS